VQKLRQPRYGTSEIEEAFAKIVGSVLDGPIVGIHEKQK